MSRTLYRAYLYVMCVALLIFAAVMLGTLLNTLLLFTPLRGIYDAIPDRNALIQNSVLAVVAIVLSVAVGGLHYWLMRRDLAQDPAAGGSAVRSLALNLVQAVAALVMLYAGLNGLFDLAQAQNYSGATIVVAIWIVAALVFALVQLERSRTEPAPGAATILRRLHLYGVQIVVLITALFVVGGAVDRTIRVLMIAGHAIANPCVPSGGEPFPPPPGLPPCSYTDGLLGGWLQALWVIVLWGGYLWLARGDARSTLRQVASYLGYAIGVATLVIGLERAFEVVLRAAMHTGDGFASEFANGYQFVSLIVLGAFVLWVYAYWLRSTSGATALGRQGTQLTMIALAAVAFGIPFYVGVAQIGRGLLEGIVRGASLTRAEWSLALALLIAGLAHILLAYLLRARTTGEAPIGPRRAYTLTALAAGGLTATIAAAMGLYIVVTATLGSPVSQQWALDARTALINTLVGLFIAGLHLWRYLEQRRSEPHAVPVPATVPATAPYPLPSVPTPAMPAGADPVGAVLDALLTGQLTRDQAAARLRELIPPASGVVQQTPVR